MRKIIILLGVPGSGKGTQAKFIAEKYNYAHISTGDLLRALENDPMGDKDDKAKLAEMKAGRLVADELIYKLAFNEIQKNIQSGKGVVLDGAIRSLDQAKAYQKFFADNGWSDDVVAVEIAIPDEEIMRRLESRIASGTARADDTPEIMRERIALQGNEVLRPIADYYASLGILKQIDGKLSISDVNLITAKIIEKE